MGSSEKPTTRRYSPEQKLQAVRLVRKIESETGQRHGAVKRVAAQLGYGVESVRSWVKQERWRFGAALAVTLIYAVLDEIHQLGVPGRFGSLTDVALNAVGAVLVLTVMAARQRGRGCASR